MSARREDRDAAGALVLDAQSRAGLATLQSLGRHGIPVDVASEAACLADRSRYVRHSLRQPRTSDSAAFLRWLEEVAGANPYALIVPSTEVSLRGFLSLPSSHPLRRAAVLPSNEALETALSKEKTREAADALGIAVPRSRLLLASDPPTPPERFPLVLKPCESVVTIGSRFVGLRPVPVRNRAEWREALDRLLPRGPVLEQEFVSGGGVGIECLYRDGARLWHFQHERVHELPLTGGGSSYRRSSPVDERLLSDATRLLDHLKWHGVAMVEFKGSADRGYTLMEINPRLWGSLPLSVEAGVDFPMGLWRVATGADPGPQPRYRTRHYQRNLEMDVDWMKENLRADRSDPLLLMRPRLRSVLEVARPLLGMERWDHFDWADRRVGAAILRHAIAKIARTARSPWRRWEHRPLLKRHEKLLNGLRGNGSGRVERVLFVCHGNICRSPLAERYAKALLPQLEAASSGFHDSVGRTAPGWYQTLTAERGVDLSACRSRRLDPAQVEWADLILLADLKNYARLRLEFPGAMRKATLLGLFAPQPEPSIEDPFDQEPDQARATIGGVMAAVEGFARWSLHTAPS
jgi:protein-tyrosine-phosphatase/predicted ATP-grasp superfamily ATP-dependent carboligase